MDHLMPGMDGFQAVQAIKNNPRTATIPIMMYTSQEGELYLGQARALGAVGVLPKQIKPTDVSKVLYQLHLVPDRAGAEQSSFTPVDATVNERRSARTTPWPLTDTTLREQFAELRRALVAGVDTQTDRITAEVRALLLEALPLPAEPAAGPAGPPWAWVIATVALAIALASTLLWWRSSTHLSASPPRWPSSGRSTRRAATPVVAPSAVSPAPPAAESRPISVLVPYAADALGGPRLEVIASCLTGWRDSTPPGWWRSGPTPVVSA